MSNVYNVCDFGALGDGKTDCTNAIQTAIDKCSQNGGGKVLIENGEFLSKPLTLKSNVELCIEYSAVLVASTKVGDYCERENVKHVDSKMLPRGRNACFIFADECENVSVTGKGKIFCSGENFVEKDDSYYTPFKRVDKPTPPRVMFFAGCKNVKLLDFSIVNETAGWTFWIHDCDECLVKSVTVRCNLDMPNNDGIHVNSSRNVEVTDCFLTCSDDTLVVRANNASLREKKVCENVRMHHCTLHSHAAGVRVGWLNDGVIRNCEFYNLEMFDCTTGVSISLPINSSDERWPDQGIEPTRIENLTFRDITMQRGYDSLLFIRIGDHQNTYCDTIKDIYFENIKANGARMPYIVGRKQNVLQNIVFRNCEFTQIPFDQVDDGENHGSLFHHDKKLHPLEIRYANVKFENTSFNIIGE